jgi:hypothetical protein
MAMETKKWLSSHRSVRRGNCFFESRLQKLEPVDAILIGVGQGKYFQAYQEAALLSPQ